MERIKSLYVSTAAGQSGVLFKDAQHQFLYDPDLLEALDTFQSLLEAILQPRGAIAH